MVRGTILIINNLNRSTSILLPNKKSEKEWTVKNDKIYYDDKLVLLVRGWGMLTGNGGCGFTEKTALILQNDLIKYVVEQLNR